MTKLNLFDEEEDTLHPLLEKALYEIFERFDEDKDGALNEKELEAFSSATNGEPFDEDTIEEIKDNFDINDDGHLTKKGFYQMYHLQTLSEPEETWKDLKKHGYNDQLELTEEK
ncbi:hypothetical protein K493DRAFT_203001 [Basidiobolus meristosporus CBS 931.73]|uniref:EF-hand domain-containing protein n=1 Tax=Basidiobolus meristosporus CBS 931.73 TaxID=1314790 RepID=A0A1Y1Z961_9FUNG|nr:hypothetical protein K493DRAFT_203001 [Basidiobolus meristosporus CBS 931.73]|eukprot:ORY06716.1 hypothetical protein K493DRAFT_203001 [Basidiobolus meristosporus CBS 931.73]